MDEEHSGISRDRLWFFDREGVVLGDFDASGLVLDIGAGGEGVIGRLKGTQVIAIDPSADELREAAPGPLKIVMDATDLQFLDCSFETATSFYTLMYLVENEEQRRVFEEIYRILKAGGRFLIWDAAIPPRHGERQDVAVFPLDVHLPSEDLDVAYGALWPKQGRSVAHYVWLAEQTGFELTRSEATGHRMFLDLRKKPRA